MYVYTFEWEQYVQKMVKSLHRGQIDVKDLICTFNSHFFFWLKTLIKLVFSDLHMMCITRE